MAWLVHEMDVIAPRGGAHRSADCRVLHVAALDGVYCDVGIRQDESGCYGDELLV